ncbi:P-loop containing nucleoside triphosphate hydrolase protein [Coemansia mojavensis]|nr:P-loop containing nucleoside triphosphate hydrolase protein [Coemansia mojavensis]
MRRVLHNISGEIYPGELVAIMGSSGAGKTTLLNVLAGRVQGGRLYGDIQFNGAKRDPHTFKRMLAFVEQDDLMHPLQTVKEALYNSALLRLPNSKYTLEEKEERVETVLRQLRLTHIKDSKIGGFGDRGVSGGERKRVSIGTELVTDPSILVLDEPSSGLDSSSAEMVITLTKEMARQRNLGTLMTIHQPSAEMVAKFDKLILLSQGKLVYMGPANQALPYFESLGYPSTNSNPANFYIDLMTIDFSSPEAMNKSEERVQSLVDSFSQFREKGEWRKHNGSENVKDITHEEADLALHEAPPMNSWLSELLILLKRDWALTIRSNSFVYGVIVQCLAMMIFVSFVFFQLDNDQASVQNRVGTLFTFVLVCTFPVVIPVMTVVMVGRSVLLRERSGGTYRMSSYFLARTLSFVPIIYVPYLVMFTGAYFITHLQYDAGKYFIGLAIIIVHLFASIGFAFAMAMMVSRIEVAHTIAPVTLATLMLFAGNLSNAKAITPVLRWIKYICIFFYSYAGLFQNEFNGLAFTCSSSDATCYARGEDVVASYGLDQLPIWACIVINLGLGIAFFVVAYGLLRWVAKPRFIWI